MEKNENIDMKRLFDVVLSKKLIIITIILMSIFLGYWYSYHYKQNEYESSALILLTGDEKEGTQITQSDLSINSNLMITYSNIAKSTTVLEKTINNLGMQMSAEDLQKDITVVGKTNTQILQLSVRNKEPEIAMKIARELTNVFAEQIKEIYNLNNINIVDEAEIETQPCNINHTKDMILFVVIGIILSGVLVLTIYFLDDTIKSENDIKKYFKIQVLGSIPLKGKNKRHKLITYENPKSYIAEAIKTTRTNILYSANLGKSKSILITNIRNEEGKIWLANNLAVSFAQANKRTILIDCNLRTPNKKSALFEVDAPKGLSDFINEITGHKIKNIQLSEKYIKETSIPNLHLLTSGSIPPNPSELISSSNMKKIVETFKYMYDVIILESHSCLEVSDSIALSAMTDGTILVAESKKTRISEIKKSKKLIEGVHGNLLGIIINQKKYKQKEYYNKSAYAEKDYNEKDEELKEKFNSKKIVTVKEIIEQAKIKVKEEDRYQRYSAEKRDKDKQESIEMRIGKMIKRFFEKFLYFKKRVIKDREAQEETNKELMLKINSNKEKADKGIRELTEKSDYMLSSINLIKSNDENIQQDIKGLVEKNNTISSEIDVLNAEKQALREQITRVLGESELNLELLKSSNTSIVNNINRLNSEKEDILDEIRALKEEKQEILESMEITHNETMQKMSIKNKKMFKQMELLRQEIETMQKEIMDLKKLGIKINDTDEQISQAKLMQGLQISNINKKIEQLKEMQANNNNEILEKISVINSDATTNNEVKINKNQKKSQNNVISFDEIRTEEKKKQKVVKKSFSIDEDIMFEDLEKTAVCELDFSTIEGAENINQLAK